MTGRINVLERAQQQGFIEAWHTNLISVHTARYSSVEIIKWIMSTFGQYVFV